MLAWVLGGEVLSGYAVSQANSLDTVKDPTNADEGCSLVQSKFILEATGELISVGSGKYNPSFVILVGVKRCL